MKHADTKVFLHPGDFHFSSRGGHVHTVLGSCVAITLWHPRLRAGGMCHFVLPTRPAGASHPAPCGRFAPEAIRLFEDAARGIGTKLDQYDAKIFGGANMFGDAAGSAEDLVGARNAEAAITLLMERGVEILVAHVGESGSRRVVLDLESGDVWVKHDFQDGRRARSLNGVS